MNRSLVAIAAAAFLAFGSAGGHGPRDAVAADDPSPWQEIVAGREGGVGGVAVLDEVKGVRRVLAVHDGKKAGALRATLVSLDADGRVVARTPLVWAGEPLAVDLEAAAAIPDEPGRALLMASGGGLFRVSVSGSTVKVEKFLSVKATKEDVEGLALAKLGGVHVVAFADRGKGPTPARLFVGTWDPKSGYLAVSEAGTVSVPFPDPSSEDTRHVSDLFLDAAGILWGAASNDPGDDGPFRSAVYALGTVAVAEDGKTVAFRANPELAPVVVSDRKIEGLALVPGATGGLLLATDDENRGGALRFR